MATPVCTEWSSPVEPWCFAFLGLRHWTKELNHEPFDQLNRYLRGLLVEPPRLIIPLNCLEHILDISDHGADESAMKPLWQQELKLFSFNEPRYFLGIKPSARAQSRT